MTHKPAITVGDEARVSTLKRGAESDTTSASLANIDRAYAWSRSMRKPQIGAERWTVERLGNADVEAEARKNGWTGEPDSLRDYVEPYDVATYTTHASLDDATEAARAYLKTGDAFYGCVIIDHDIYEAAHDDRGRAVKGASWERQKSYEVAMDGERIEVTPCPR